ncbi:uncharacterized protein LOC128039932 [Gossypium raimondii]|uniref:uncharacterized protein LOC128039932 n=1 Tax=Gossypium raimondii TaxID=29730 RepID=UPI00227BB1F4|nr:uncharacterized protein LOC128039932 [Gossypium raimondii]
MAPFEALYGRRCRTPLCWAELHKKKIGGPKMVCETDNKVGKHIFLKVSPWKKFVRFGHKKKISPRFIDLFEVVERASPVAYRLKLPSEIDKIDDVFHVSILRRYCIDSSHVVVVDEVEVRPDLTYEEEPVKIMAREVKVL